MKLLTPAKVNLTLRIERKREDGFHDLATWMLPIGLFDALEVEMAGETTFSSNVPDLRFDSGNLIYRAVEAFRKATGISQDYRVNLEKQIPIGAGLGGGSSNASATLLALNRLHHHPLSNDALISLAAGLGSDTAFFILNQPAWCTGRGETMELKKFPSDYWITLFKPDFAVSTAGAYAAYGRLPQERRQGERAETPWGVFQNDLEPAVFQKYLLLPIIKGWLRAQGETIYAAMSGSGSTMFAIVENQEDGQSLLARFEQKFGDRFWSANCQLNPDPGLAGR